MSCFFMLFASIYVQFSPSPVVNSSRFLPSLSLSSFSFLFFLRVPFVFLLCPVLPFIALFCFPSSFPFRSVLSFAPLLLCPSCPFRSVFSFAPSFRSVHCLVFFLRVPFFLRGFYPRATSVLPISFSATKRYLSDVTGMAA